MKGVARMSSDLQEGRQGSVSWMEYSQLVNERPMKDNTEETRLSNCHIKRSIQGKCLG